MSKILKNFILFLTFTFVLAICSFFLGCGSTSNETNEPESEPVPYSIEITGMKTDFITGDVFSAGDLTVTVKQGEQSSVISKNKYVLDYSQFNSSEGEYTIKVTVPEYELETSYKVVVREYGWTKDYLIP